MMPVLNKPTIQYVVEEAVRSGIDDILIITGRGKESIQHHFDKSYELESELRKAGKDEILDRVRKVSNLADIHYVRQKERNGLGDAVLYARKHVGDEPFALLLGDTIVESDVPCTRQLIEYAEEYDQSVLALERVPWEKVPSYGVVDVEDPSSTQPCFPVSELVEKPARETAPSNLAITGRYVLQPAIFDQLEATEPGVGGELQLTDAINELPAVRGTESAGRRYDIGDIPSWLEANIRLAMKHETGATHRAVERLLEEWTDE
ncbi:UTP-glucose-1-phosphate uridylyltransferase [Halococcus salifodinae DSM 8989]|uniref:UTP--glucose-1-phosphate uridylyltransferase n=2 Tax=Halococcaceae TaxID=1963270 RepID=M0N5A3_9EURY|nr:UTP-glucose-1-phosphate uridylyltransferase [Halococcus salifodinae DSM 8989]